MYWRSRAVHIILGSINFVLVSNGVLLNGESHLFSILLTCPMTLNIGYLLFAWVYSCAELSFT